MDEAKRHEIRQWLIKAEHDLRSARRLLGDTPPLLDTAAYHCQQTAEKALKAFLTLHDIPFPKTHLLLPLVERCTKAAPGFADLQEAAESLTPFATAFRYPGDVLEPEQSDVLDGIELAELVFNVVLSRIPVEVKQDENGAGVK
jgi:HEPN domain-containing protein